MWLLCEEREGKKMVPHALRHGMRGTTSQQRAVSLGADQGRHEGGSNWYTWPQPSDTTAATGIGNEMGQ